VPTPFYHLQLAEDLLRQSSGSVPVRCLQSHRPAFLLGSTAPDVQTISGQKRFETHFFELPLQHADLLPWKRMLAAHPGLDNRGYLDCDLGAFLAGYACHLLADWLWVRRIYAPVFGPDCDWDTLPRRSYLHNALRAYLDQQIWNQLPADLGQTLAQAFPQAWLPFAADTDLIQWRDWLVDQLSPGGAAQTVEVFAARQGIAPQEYYALINSEARLESEVFSRLPRVQLEAYRQELWAETIQLLQSLFEMRFS
jgi:hypothetical protein